MAVWGFVFRASDELANGKKLPDNALSTRDHEIRSAISQGADNRVSPTPPEPLEYWRNNRLPRDAHRVSVQWLQ